MNSEPEEVQLPEWPLWYQRSVQPYLAEDALWPILLALWGHLVVALAGLLLSLYRNQSPIVFIIGLWLIFASYKTLQFERRHLGSLGRLSLTVFATWIFSVIVAVFVDYTGIY